VDTNQWAGYMLATTNGGTTQYTQISPNTGTTLTLNGTITGPSGAMRIIHMSFG
jgi:hypothetical protein